MAAHGDDYNLLRKFNLQFPFRQFCSWGSVTLNLRQGILKFFKTIGNRKRVNCCNVCSFVKMKKVTNLHIIL